MSTNALDKLSENITQIESVQHATCKHCGCPKSRHHPASGCCPLPYGGFPDEHDNEGYSLFRAFESDPENGVAT